MSQAVPRPMPEQICRECGATNEPGASECWLCQRRDWRPDGASRPAKAAVAPRGDRSRERIAIAIVAISAAILGLGMLLDIWRRPDLLSLVLLIATLTIPVGLILWSRARERPPKRRSMTNRELAASGSTIAAGVILVTWLVQVFGFESMGIIATILAVLAVPAGLITWVRAGRRRWEKRPMTGLQLIASVIFLTVLLPALLLASLVIALWLICLAVGPPSFH